MNLINFLTISVLVMASAVDAQKKVVCYWFPESTEIRVDPFICTHVIYSFLGINAQGGLNHLHRSEAQALDYIQRLNAMRFVNPNLRTMVAVGGYNPDMVPLWYTMAENYDYRMNFARNILAFLQANNLNGVDIDWEYPNYDGNRPQDKQNFVLLLQALREVLGTNYLLTTATGAGAWRTDLSYDYPAINYICDFINLMTYDLHGAWGTVTGIHGAMFRGPNDQTDQNMDASVNVLMARGVDRHKLIVGIPAYGIGFTLSNANNNGVGAPFTSGGHYYQYYNICGYVNSGAWNLRFEDAQRVPYMFQGTQWIGYDNVQSVEEKSRYVVQYNLGGTMFWSIDGDDYNGVCGQGRWPLITASYRIVMA